MMNSNLQKQNVTNFTNGLSYSISSVPWNLRFSQNATPFTSYSNNTLPSSATFPTVVGCAQPALYTYKLCPPGYVDNAVCPPQNITANTPLTFNYNSLTDANNRIVAYPLWMPSYAIVPINKDPARSVYGVQYGQSVRGIQFPDLMETSLWINFSGPIATQANVTIYGYDARNVPVAESTFIQVGEQAIQTNKAYNKVWQIVFSANPGVSVQVANGTFIGFPYALVNLGNVIKYSWPNTGVSATQVSVCNPWRKNFDLNDYTDLEPSELTSFPYTARGGIYLGTKQYLTGTSQLWITYYTQGADSANQTGISNNNRSQVLNTNTVQGNPAGLSTTYLSVGDFALNNVYKNTTSNFYKLTELVPYDLTGVQFPGDLDWINTYNAIATS